MRAMEQIRVVGLLRAVRCSPRELARPSEVRQAQGHHGPDKERERDRESEIGDDDE